MERDRVIEIELWQPCMDCEHANVVVREHLLYNGQVVKVTCGHAAVCSRIYGARPLIGGER